MRTLLRRSLRTSLILPVALVLAGPGCSSEAPRGAAEVEPQTTTTTEGLPNCPSGSFATDCNPETICNPTCHIVTVCTCTPIPLPDIPSGGGPVLPSLQLVTVAFQGDTQNDNSLTGADASAFGDFVVHSKWLQTVTADYRTGSSFVASHVAHHDLPPYPGGAVDVPTLLTNAFNSSVIPFPTNPGGYLYEVFVPQAGCSGGASRHDSFTYGGYYVAWAQVCGNAVFMPGERAASEEIIEAITNPYGNGFNFSQGPIMPWTDQGEVVDACSGIPLAAEGGYTLATAWSNSAANVGGRSPCVPAPGAYYNVVPTSPISFDEADTTPVTAQVGSTVNVTLTGWALGASSTATWEVTAAFMEGVTVQPKLVGTQGSLPGSVIVGVKKPITLQITVPAGTGHGTTSWVDVTSHYPGGSQSTAVWPIAISIP